MQIISNYTLQHLLYLTPNHLFAFWRKIVASEHVTPNRYFAFWRKMSLQPTEY